jgi:glycosyltransferase involved in cell wall biosynthesis
MVTCAYPHHSSISSGTFVANWAQQLKENGLTIRVYKRDHITIGSYFSSLQRVIKFYSTPRIYEYEWQGIKVYRQGIHLRLPLDHSKVAPSITYKKIKPIIKKIYKEYDFDLIYLATWGDLSLAMSWIAREMKVPYVASAIGDHTNLYYNKPKSIYYKYHREIFLGAKIVICVSQDLNNKVKIMTENKANTFTYYSGVDVNKFKKSEKLRFKYRRLLKYEDDDFTIIFVGRLTKQKGFYDLLDACKELLNKNIKFKLIVIGELNEKKKIKKHIERLGLINQITLVGALNHEEICHYMNAADVLVLPSWMEGLPNVIMEACASELPVIAAEVGGIPELIVNNDTGFLIKRKSTSEIGDKILFLCENKKIADNMGKNARKRMIQKFNYNENGRLITSRITDLINT